MKNLLLFVFAITFSFCCAQTSKDSIRDLRSLVKKITEENNDLIKQKNDLTTQKENLSSEVAKLTDRLSQVDRILPNSIQPGKIVVLDNKIFIQFHLNKKGFVRTKVFRTPNSKEPETVLDSNYDESPIFKFTNLSSDTNYYITATILTYDGREIKTVSFNDFDKLKQKTLSPIDHPNISLSVAKVTDSKISIPIVTSKPVNYKYTYSKIQNNFGERTLIQVGTYNSAIEPDQFGHVDNVNYLDNITIDNLQPQTEYDIKFTFYDENGNFYEKTTNYKTQDKPLNLEFVDGVKVNYNILKSIISWKFTKKPSSAYINFQTEDGRTLVNTKADILKDSCYVELDANTFKNLINAANTQKGSGLPKINVVMIDENGSKKELSFEVKISIPSEDEINSARNITENEKGEMVKSTKQVRDYLNGKKSDGKIDWAKIAKIGVPLLLSIF
ncbi:hypothetical protein [Chryseobacterium nepalense]|uniref:hypothetical protein n=1 Tax=Chryseobacterium nepalense TaxID=1854498 RepID=UPI002E047A8B|nr:hypothetical protein [Chryseobacterium nepalense]